MEPRNRTQRFGVRGYRLWCAFVLLAALTMFSLQALNGFASGWFLAGICLALLLRIPFLRVRVDGHGLRSATWFYYSRSVPLAEITSVDVLPYAGAWARGGSIFWLDQLHISLSSEAVARGFRCSGIVGLRRDNGGTVESIAAALRQTMSELRNP